MSHQSVKRGGWLHRAKYSVALSSVRPIAHGLGRMPELCLVYLECEVANNGYSVGDYAFLGPNNHNYNEGLGITIDPVNVTIVTLGSVWLISKNNHLAWNQIVPSEWKWRVLAR